VSNVETTFVAIKPDGVERKLIGRVIERFEQKGLTLVGMKLTKVSEHQAEQYYGEHKGKGFYPGLIEHITSGPIVAMVWRGPNAVAQCRQAIGKTNPVEAAPGSIRGDYAVELGRNVVHGSDSTTSAEREIGIFFKKEDIMNDWTPSVSKWVFELV